MIFWHVLIILPVEFDTKCFPGLTWSCLGEPSGNKSTSCAGSYLVALSSQLLSVNSDTLFGKKNRKPGNSIDLWSHWLHQERQAIVRNQGALSHELVKHRAVGEAQRGVWGKLRETPRMHRNLEETLKHQEKYQDDVPNRCRYKGRCEFFFVFTEVFHQCCRVLNHDSNPKS